MAFDGLMMYKISNELKNCIIGGKIDKIFEPNSNEVVLGIYNNGLKYLLNIVTYSNNYRLSLTTNPKSNPTFAPNFCMALRKYLLNTRITNFTTIGLERIAVLELEGHNKSGDFSPKKLIIELMGKHSNIILLNSDNIIIDALKHFSTINSNSYRNILPGYQYYEPISDKLNFIDTLEDFEIFYQNLLNRYSENESVSLSSAVSNTYIGLSQTSISYFIKDLNLSDVLTKSNSEKLYLFLKELISSDAVSCLLDEHNYYLTINKNKIDDASTRLSLNFFIDDYYYRKESNESYINYKNQFSRLILQHLKKLNVKLSTINSKLKECENADIYKLYGELITSNLYKIDSKHLDTISLENYYDNNNLVTIPLDKSITPSDNAKKYFKKYHKLKNAKLIVENQKSEVEKELNYLESIVFALQTAQSIEDIDEIYNEFSENFREENALRNKSKKVTKKKSSKKERKQVNHIGEPIKYTIEGFQVLVGKNNMQNDYITKHASSNDLWFHAKDIHGSHVILKTNSKSPSQETINKCASIAALHSKAKESDNVSVDYTYVKYVKKPSKAKPGMVIYTHEQTVNVNPYKKQT